YIEISEAGEYTFYTTSDDGSALFINDQIVVDNDGLHAEQEKSGTLTLEKGKHAIRATFFEKTGKEVFNVSYEGPGFSKKTIPQTVLFLPENKPSFNRDLYGLHYSYYEGSW